MKQYRELFDEAKRIFGGKGKVLMVRSAFNYLVDLESETIEQIEKSEGLSPNFTDFFFFDESELINEENYEKAWNLIFMRGKW